MPSLTLKQIADVLGTGSSEEGGATHYAIDSRNIRRGSLFFAIKGAKVDGHDFLSEVAQRGAVGAVVHEGYQKESFGLPLIRVNDVTTSLQILGSWVAKARTEQFIAITGSMGKTTTKEFLHTLLSIRFQVAKSPGNYNTQLTLPLNLLNLPDERGEIIILEMAMSRKGEIAKLVEIAPPDVALVTAIAPAGMVGTLEEIAEAKGEIFTSQRTQLGFLGPSAFLYPSLRERGGVPKVRYGMPDQSLPLSHLPIHLQECALGAIAVARHFGLSEDEIARGCLSLQPMEKRFQKVEKNGITFISDSYNANPFSMRAAFSALPSTQGKRVAVLGAMPDLGEASADYHSAIGKEAVSFFSELFCIGKEAKAMALSFSEMGKKGRLYTDLDSLREELYQTISPGDVVLLKGGNSFKLWELLEDSHATSHH